MKEQIYIEGGIPCKLIGLKPTRFGRNKFKFPIYKDSSSIIFPKYYAITEEGWLVEVEQEVETIELKEHQFNVIRMVDKEYEKIND